MIAAHVSSVSGVVALLVVAGGAARADVVTAWNDAYQQAIRVTGLPVGGPGEVARAGAMMHGAMFDALNAIEGGYNGYLWNTPSVVQTNKNAAMATAAHAVATNVYGASAATVAAADALYAGQMAAIPDGPAKSAGVALGSAVAGQYMARAATDGASNLVPYTPGANPGDWQLVPPNNGGPVGPHWGNVTPWAMTSGDQFRPAAPPALDSVAYAAAYDDVKELGSINSATRTADQTHAAWFWANDRAGTYLPPGHLNNITQEVSDQRFVAAGLSEEQATSERARLFALVNIAMADAGIAAWDCKYNTPVDLWRPTTGIRQGDSDGNDATVGDANWQPLSETVAEVNGTMYGGYVPGFPAYVSGHATFGAAHAAIMRAFFGTDNVDFTISSEDPFNTGDRTFSSFSQAALENARSRIYLGVHWDFDGAEGYTCGTALGDWAYDHAFTAIPAPGVAGVLVTGALLGAARRRR
ncbi:MAG: vanadium-dependent haloperoxidase [Phycisphaerales bacterium]